jgi:hypothetical protein
MLGLNRLWIRRGDRDVFAYLFETTGNIWMTTVTR